MTGHADGRADGDERDERDGHDGHDHDGADARDARDARDNGRRAWSRRGLLAGGVGLAAGLAGCAGVVGDPTSFEAEAATVSDAALSETGYGEFRVRSETSTRTFEAGGQSQDVEVTSQVAEYDRAIEVLGERFQGAAFTVLSTPQVTVLGATFNPVGDMSNAELAELIQDRYDGVENVERAADAEYATEVLGTETRVVRYDADGDIADLGLTVDLRLHIADVVEAGEDFVVPLAAYPTAIDDGDAVLTLLNGVEHPAV